tara:strand:- start:237 stop:434 length:198 start_codon:yes stop_codon:yes gene_type:complete
VSIAVSDATSTRFALAAARAIVGLLAAQWPIHEEVSVCLLEKMHRAFAGEGAENSHRKKYSGDNT